MGIHGEPGTHRAKIAEADSVASQLLSLVVNDLGLQEGDRVAVMINSLGATPQMELYVLNKTVGQALKSRGIQVHKTYVGEYMTSLEMAGCSISVLRLDEELAELLDADADTLGWK